MITGRIYAIYNTVDNQECIGSTTRTLDGRWSVYKSKHNNPNCRDYNMKICKLMREYGWDNFNIELLEEIQCEGKRELECHEYNWMDTMENEGYHLTNTIRGIGLSRKEYYLVNPEARQKKLDKQKEKIACPDCTMMITSGHIARHRLRYHS